MICLLSTKHHSTYKLFRSAGFTLIEMIMTLVIIGILSVTALPRFFDLGDFQQRTFFDDTLNAIRYAQKLAIATNCNVQVVIAGNQYTLKRPAASDRSQCLSTTASQFTQNVPRPGSGDSSYQGSQSGIALTDATLYFTAEGKASAGMNITVGNHVITIVQDTGLVYDATP